MHRLKTMISFPTSTMPPSGENWFPPCASSGSTERPIPPAGNDIPVPPPVYPNFPVLPPPVPPPHFAGVPRVIQGMDPALFVATPYHPVHPVIPGISSAVPPMPAAPMVLDPHKINEAESLKFICENDRALKNSRRRSNSRDYHKGGSSTRDSGRETSRGRTGRDRSRSRNEYRSRSKGRNERSRSSSNRNPNLSQKRRRSRSADPLRRVNNSHFRTQRSRDRGRSQTPRGSDRDAHPSKRSGSRDKRTSGRSPGRDRREGSPRPGTSSSLARLRSPRRDSMEDNSRRSLIPQQSHSRGPDVPLLSKDGPGDVGKALPSGSSCDPRSENKRSAKGYQPNPPRDPSLGKGRRVPYQPNTSLNGLTKGKCLPVGNRRGAYNKRGLHFRGNYNSHGSSSDRGSSNYTSSKDSSSKAHFEDIDKDNVLAVEESPDSDGEIIEEWVRSAPSELYYTKGENGVVVATERAKQLCQKFYNKLVSVAKEKRLEAEALGAAQMAKMNEEDKKESQQKKCHKAHHKCSKNSNSSSESDSMSDDSQSDCEEMSSRSDTSNKELERRKKHPRRLHEELWHNEPGQMNDGPVCRCSAKARRFGIRHGFYPGESSLKMCDPFSNNANKLFHYKILINPATNLVIRSPTVISHDNHEYIFEGFSIFSHYKLDEKLPPCRVIRFNIRYCMAVAEEKFPQNFCVQDLKLFETYIFREVLELVDLSYDPAEEVEEGHCSQFHLMPRFARQLPDNGKEILSMDKVLQHLIKSDKELIEENDLKKYLSVDQSVWQDFADKHKGTIVVKRGMKPCAIRVDQIDRNVECQGGDEDGIPFPLIVHFGIRPPQLSYAGNVEYQRAWRRFVKYRHLLSNMPKPKIEDKRKLLEKDLKLQEMRTRSTMKRDVTVDISAKGFRTTGVCCDLVQHAMLIPVLFAHMRFHKSLDELERQMSYEFKNRYFLQLAMTHPSYRENFGTNPDHARNALTNCGIRQPEYGDRSIHYASSRKRGINTLIDIMARFGMKYETESEITHNERLEFLGDAVVEFVTSIHLFHIFPELEEGGLATYRAAIVQNQHLAVLAQNLGLDRFMLYAHGSDLCHDSELRHAMANCFEALMGALFLDGGSEVWSQIMVADRVFAYTMYGNEGEVLDIWVNYPKHPLQIEEPKGDRHWIQSHVALQKLSQFEADTGIEFSHIRLLARAFTDRSLGYNNLSRGSNQRLEFLGDTVLQLIASEYLYRHFPDHHEGHLSLLRSSLVNNRTQAKVCDILGMAQYSMRHDPKSEMKTKDRADLLEAFLGALYIDQGLESCVVFCSVCFFPRLTESIINQDWNDPKSKLQQCCLTLRSMDGKEPEIPTYKVTEVMGPTNTRVYKVAVYFKNKRLATSRGHSIQEAEMNAASNALVKRDYLFPQLKHQKRLLEKTTKKISQSQLFDKQGSKQL